MGLRTLFTKIKSWIRRTWRKLTSIVVAVGTTIGAVFLFLASIGAITILGHSGDVMCAGTIDDPCYTYINFTAEKNFWIDFSDHTPYGLNDTLEFVPDVQSWKIQHSWLSEWKDFSDTMVYFEKNNDYQVRIVSYKVNPYDHVKWSAFDGLVGADFLADTNPNNYKETLEWNGKVLDLYPLNMEFDEKGNKILLKDDKTSNDGYTFKTISEKVTEVWKDGEMLWKVQHSCTPWQVKDFRKTKETAYPYGGKCTDTIEGSENLVLFGESICHVTSNYTPENILEGKFGYSECWKYPSNNGTTTYSIKGKNSVVNFITPYDPLLISETDLIAYWPLNETSGTTMYNYGSTETYSMIHWDAGDFTWETNCGYGDGTGPCAEGYGVDSGFSYDTPYVISRSKDVSIIGWVQPKDCSSARTWDRHFGQGGSLEIVTGSDGSEVCGQFRDSGGSYDKRCTDCHEGEWYLMMVTQNSSTNISKMYHNCSQLGADFTGNSDWYTTNKFAIGGETNGNYQNSSLAHIASYDATLTVADCLAFMDATNGTAPEPPADTCTYSSGDWEIDCDDNCSITSAVAIDSGYNITITGTGTFSTTKNITGFTNLRIEGTDSSNRCVVTCSAGGCFNQ